jgi:plastocyanin
MRVLTTRFALGALVFGSVLATADTASGQLLPGRRARLAARQAAYVDPCCYAGAGTVGAAYSGAAAPVVTAGYAQPAYAPSAVTYGYTNPCCPPAATVAYGGAQFRYGYGASMYFPSPGYAQPAYGGGYAQPMPYAGGIHHAGYPQGHVTGAIPAGGIVPGQLPTRPADGTTGDAAVETKAAKILDGSFEPADLEVKVGTTVKWTNEGEKPHTVTSDKGDWGSGELAKGQTFTATFTKPGTFDYHCKIHPEMKARITVK